jgi:hypothetical protein
VRWAAFFGESGGVAPGGALDRGSKRLDLGRELLLQA